MSKINSPQIQCLVRPLPGSHTMPSPCVLKWQKGWGRSDPYHGGSTLMTSSLPKHQHHHPGHLDST